MADRWDIEDGDDGGLDHEPGDVQLNARLRSLPKPRRVFQRPAEPPDEIKLAVFDRGEYVGRSPFDIGEIRDGVKIRDGVPDKFLEKIVATADGGFASAAPRDMDPNLYAACVSALAFRRGGREIVVSNNGQPAYNPWQPVPQAPPPQPWQPGPPQWPTQPQMQQPAQPRFAMPTQAVRMPCGHLTTSLASDGGRPVCGDCGRLQALRDGLGGIDGISQPMLDAIMQAVRDWEFALRSQANV